MNAPSTPPVAVRARSSLRLTIGLLLPLLVTLTTAVIVWLSYHSSKSSMLTVSATIMDRVGALGESHTAAFLGDARKAVEVTARDLDQGLIGGGADLQVGLEAHFFSLLHTLPSLTAASYGDQDGNFLMVTRTPDGAFDTKLVQHDAAGGRKTLWRRRAPGADPATVAKEEEDPSDTYDPRTRPWYQGAAEATKGGRADSGSGTFWSDVYVFFTSRQPGLTVADAHVGADGTLRGVVSVDISLASLSEFLGTVEVSKSGAAYLVDGAGRIVASPSESVIKAGAKEGTLQIMTLADSQVAPLAALGRDPAFASAIAASVPARVATRYDVGNDAYAAVANPVSVGSGRAWWVAVLAPEDDFLGGVKRHTRNSIVIAGVLGFVAVLLSGAIGRQVTRAMRKLRDECSAIRGLDFAHPPQTPSPFLEVNEVLVSMEGMKVGLQSFQKYMPIELVRMLLAKGQEPRLEAQEKELTIMFSDVAGFTTISEKLEPMVLSDRLGHYHGQLTERIQEHQGTVCMYIGDAIMAFWNAPLDVPDHATRACAAALTCLGWIDTLPKDNPRDPAFPTRFGLHTARVSVGHFGSPNRLLYTAFGDGVNLASRIEGINKVYGTSVILSDDTQRQIASQYETRRLDLVTVKGRKEPVALHELLGRKGEVPAPRLTARSRYEEGLALYVERKWDRAISAFSGVLEVRDDDLASKLMLERAEAYRKTPPPDGWQGAYVMTTK